MATNGTNGMQDDAREAMIRQQALAGPRPAPKTVAPVADVKEAGDDITSQIADTARTIRDIGRYAREHGEYLQKISEEYADRLQTEGRNYASQLLNSERRKLGELEKIMGRNPPRGGEDGRTN